MPLTIAYYSFDNPAYACARLRVLEPARLLEREVRLLPGALAQGPGHHVRTDILHEADLVLIQRYFPCPGTVPALETIFASGKPVLYDTDDDWSAIPRDHPFAVRLATVLPHILETARRAQLVTVSTPVLADVFRAITPHVQVVPNFLPAELWPPTPPPTRPIVAVGLAGTASHTPDLAPILPMLADISQAFTGKVRFVFFGCPPPGEMLPEATVVPFASEYPTYAGKLPRLGCAVGLAPLRDTPFNRAKSPIKWMEYARSGMAGIFADLPPYRAVVENEKTGLLVGPNPQDWREALTRLLRDAAFRNKLANQAQEAVSARHLLGPNAEKYLRVWRQTAEGGCSP